MHPMQHRRRRYYVCRSEPPLQGQQRLTGRFAHHRVSGIRIRVQQAAVFDAHFAGTTATVDARDASARRGDCNLRDEGS